MENIIVAEGLRKEYDGFALEDVSFRVPGGAIMGLIGENGAGKTTTIKCLLNLVRRDAGTVTLLGMDDLEGEKEIKQDVGVVLDECFFHDSYGSFPPEALSFLHNEFQLCCHFLMQTNRHLCGPQFFDRGGKLHFLFVNIISQLVFCCFSQLF